MAVLAQYLHGIGLMKRFSVSHTAKMQVGRNVLLDFYFANMIIVIDYL